MSPVRGSSYAQLWPSMTGGSQSPSTTVRPEASITPQVPSSYCNMA